MDEDACQAKRARTMEFLVYRLAVNEDPDEQFAWPDVKNEELEANEVQRAGLEEVEFVKGEGFCEWRASLGGAGGRNWRHVRHAISAPLQGGGDKGLSSASVWGALPSVARSFVGDDPARARRDAVRSHMQRIAKPFGAKEWNRLKAAPPQGGLQGF